MACTSALARADLMPKTKYKVSCQKAIKFRTRIFTNFAYLKKEAQTHSGIHGDSVRPKMLKSWAARGILAKRIELRVACFE